MYVKCTKEAGSEINERDANNYKVEPAPDNWDLSDIAKYSTQVFLPGIAEVGNDPHRQQLEASLEEEDNGEDSIEVVKAVHEERLRFKPDEKRENNGLPKNLFLGNTEILPTNPLFL